MMSLILLISLELLTLPVAALPGDNCKTEQKLWGPWIFNRQFTMADGCIIQVAPKEKPALTYREYVFDETGRFMIFNSTDGPYETNTAQQNYMLLPAFQPPQMSDLGDHVLVTTASGHFVKFTKESKVVLPVNEHLDFTDSGAIDLTPGGNFVIKNFGGVLLDTGWLIGGRRSTIASETSTFRINGAPACTVQNTEIFTYIDPVTKEAYYQPIFIYASPSALEQYLITRCGY